MIKMLVTGQLLQLVTPVIVSDTQGYIEAECVFRGEEWTGLNKWLHFLKDEEEPRLVPIIGNRATNLNLSAGTWRVYIHGSAVNPETEELETRITTATAIVRVEPLEESRLFPEISAEVGEILAAQIEAARQAAEGLRADAAAGEFNGAVYMPHVDSGGNLSWTNDKGLQNPPAVNIRGASGQSGRNLSVIGYYASPAELTTAVASPEAGDAYAVGDGIPYNLYIYDAISGEWVDNGPMQGVRGEDGRAASVSIGTVTTLPPGENATVTNAGTENAAVLNFAIPKGDVPQKGVDYLTNDDISELAAGINPGQIGAIANPETKSAGQYLKFNGSKWEAASVAGGVSSVDGKSGDVTVRKVYTNAEFTDWLLSSSPIDPAHPYFSDLSIEGVTAAMLPIVTFSAQDAASGNFASFADTYSGGLRIYGARNMGTVTVQSIILFA